MYEGVYIRENKKLMVDIFINVLLKLLSNVLLVILEANISKSSVLQTLKERNPGLNYQEESVPSNLFNCPLRNYFGNNSHSIHFNIIFLFDPGGVHCASPNVFLS